MLADSKLPTTFWAEAVNTACYVQDRVVVVKPYNKTSYELFRGRTPALSFMRPFRCHVTILNTLDYLGKFDGNSDEGFFVGYSMNSRAFRVYNIRIRKVEENLHIRFLEDKPIIAGSNSNDLVGTEKSIGAGHSGKEIGSSQDYILMPINAEEKDDEVVNKERGIDDQERPENSTQDVNTAGPSINTASTNVNTDSLNINTVSPTVTTAPLEAKHVDFFGDETEIDMSNITTTYLVPSTPNTRIHKDHSLDHVIGDVESGVQTRRMTKTTNEQGFISVVYEGKTHEDLHTCLFACFLSQEEPKKGYTQEEGIDYNEVFALVARIKAIRLLLAYASFKDFVVYQMDVKSAFLYGKIEKEVYVCQPLGFEDPEFPDRVYKIDIFGSTKKKLCIEFEKLMHKKFQMSSMGELTFFLGLQVTQKDDGIFISQDKYMDEILKKFSLSTVKTASTPMETSKPLLKDAEAEDVDVHLYRSMIGSLMYLTSSRPDIMFAVCACYPKDSPFDLEAYSDSDYAGASLDRKSITGGKDCQWGSEDTSPSRWEEELERMRYENLTQKLTFYKAFFSPQWKFLIHTNLQCLSAKTTAWNEFSSTMASAIICLATNQKFNFSKYIFDNMVKNLEGGVKFLMYQRFVQVFLDKQVEGMTKHKEIYVTPSHTKREGKGFSGRVTPLFQTMMVQAPEELGEGSEIPTDPQYTPTIIQPSTSQPQKKQPRSKQRKDTEVPQPSGSIKPITDEAANAKHVPTHSNDPLFSALKETVKKLEKRNKSRTPGLKRLRKVGRFVSSEDEGLGAQEDTFKQGRKIADLDADIEQEVEVEKAVSTAKVTTVSAITTTVDELTLAQTLIEIKAAKPKDVTTAATTTTTAVTRPKARGVVVQDLSEFRTTSTSSQTSQLSQAKDKAQEQEELTVEEKSKLFVEIMDKRKKHFARLKAKEQRRKPSTKAQRRNQMYAYLKKMAGYTHSQLKNKSFDEVQKAFDKTTGWIDSFVSMDSEVVKGGKDKDEGSVTRAEERSSKRAGTEL
ncbi:putative ribonuclease H-like domain-containing protein [Tanacetum coccineum]